LEVSIHKGENRTRWGRKRGEKKTAKRRIDIFLGSQYANCAKEGRKVGKERNEEITALTKEQASPGLLSSRGEAR